jgi:outer membrane biosynthesis protein TonB
MRTGAAISVAAHVAALTAWLLLAGVRPFEPTTAEAITIDIVTPEEGTPLPRSLTTFPTLDEKAQENSQEKSQEQAAQQQDSAQQQPAEPPRPASKPKQDTKQAAPAATTG